MSVELYNDDCLAILKTLESNSVHSCVTDPPAGISFMGKEWDNNKGGKDMWIAWMQQVASELLRVIKPGGYALVWAIPRTSHWTASAFENAGWEIRDVINHIFGSGFPKSLNIAKQIDGKDGRLGWESPNKNKYRSNIGATQQGAGVGTWNKNTRGKLVSPNPIIESAIAKQWEGWGTALKPATEHWILCRKPLDKKTVAANVLEHETGALNIDACRIAGEPWKWGTQTDIRGGGYASNRPSDGDVYAKNIVGGKNDRWPSNVILSHSPLCVHVGTDQVKAPVINRWDDGSKPFGDGAGHPYTSEQQGDENGMETVDIYACVPSCSVRILDQQSGVNKSVSRFFYTAKASSKDKTANGRVINNHPTVKSTDLMRYLIRMITAPDGICIDPFMGSGSTGVAAVEEGFSFIGIEQDTDSYDTASERITFAWNEVQQASSTPATVL